jgi:hypothetical protein
LTALDLHTLHIQNPEIFLALGLAPLLILDQSETDVGGGQGDADGAMEDDATSGHHPTTTTSGKG